MATFKRLFFLILILKTFLFSQSIPQFNDDADILFERGLIQFENGKFVEARSLFSKCIFNFNTHHRTTACYIMLAKTEYSLKKYRDALLTLKEFSDYYPTSSYQREADYVSGLSFYKLNNIDTALFFLLKAYDKTSDEYDQNRIVEPIKYLSARHSSSKLPDESIFTEKNTRELISSIEKEKNSSSYGSAQKQGTDENKSGNDSEKNTTTDGQRKSASEFKEEYKIAVFTLPNNSSGRKGREDLEKDYLEAMTYGVNEFNKNSNIKISLQVIASKQDSLSLSSEIKLLASDTKILCIIGPIYSDQFGIAAGLANKFKIPIISPTATGNGLAAKGEYSFQANPDFINRAKSMAVYAAKKSNMKNIAVFAPRNVYGKMMSEQFSREVAKRGANITAVALWDSDIKQIQKSMLELVNSIYAKGGEYFLSLTDETGKDNIRKMSKAGVSQVLIDSLKARYKEVNIYSVLGSDAKSKADKLKLKIYPKMNYEVDQPVHSIDAIYIPINSKGDIKNISAALHTYKIKAKVLGTGDYNHILELDANRKYMEGLIFDSDTYFDITNRDYLNFSKKYFDDTKRKITQYSLFSYDALGFILQSVKKGNLTRESLKKYLSGANYFQGLHSKISLKNNRINSYLNILEYRNRKVSRVSEINISIE